MGVEQYRRARALIEGAGGGDFEGPKPEALVARAEAALGVTFPPSYRQFLLELGCGHVDGFEVYGIVDEDFTESTVPDGIWLTLTERRSLGLDPRYVIIGARGDGTYDCIDTRVTGADGENPVMQLSVDFKNAGTLADSFGEYFLLEVRDALSELESGEA